MVNEILWFLRDLDIVGRGLARFYVVPLHRDRPLAQVTRLVLRDGEGTSLAHRHRARDVPGDSAPFRRRKQLQVDVTRIAERPQVCRIRPRGWRVERNARRVVVVEHHVRVVGVRLLARRDGDLLHMYARALGLRHNQERKALRGRIVESLVHAARELQVFVAPVRLHVLNHHDRILHRRALLVPDREVQVQGTRARVERDSLADRDGLRAGFHGHFLHGGIVVRGGDGDARRKGLHRAVRMSSIVEDAAVRGQHRVGLARALQVRAGDLFGDDRRASRVLHTHFGGDHT